MSRTASCQCGHIEIETADDPSTTFVCNCDTCKKRTGSAFVYTAFFEADKVKVVKGKMKPFNRKADSGRNVTSYFCPDCGTTAMIELEMMPGMTGVAAGCFADPHFPMPEMAVFSDQKLDWVVFPETIKCI